MNKQEGTPITPMTQGAPEGGAPEGSGSRKVSPTPRKSPAPTRHYAEARTASRSPTREPLTLTLAERTQRSARRMERGRLRAEKAYKGQLYSGEQIAEFTHKGWESDSSTCTVTGGDAEVDDDDDVGKRNSPVG